MDFWNKYIAQVVNRDKAERYGFFWVVTEAILREGSSVLFGLMILLLLKVLR